MRGGICVCRCGTRGGWKVGSASGRVIGGTEEGGTYFKRRREEHQRESGKKRGWRIEGEVNVR